MFGPGSSDSQLNNSGTVFVPTLFGWPYGGRRVLLSVSFTRSQLVSIQGKFSPHSPQTLSLSLVPIVFFAFRSPSLFFGANKTNGQKLFNFLSNSHLKVCHITRSFNGVFFYSNLSSQFFKGTMWWKIEWHRSICPCVHRRRQFGDLNETKIWRGT